MNVAIRTIVALVCVGLLAVAGMADEPASELTTPAKPGRYTLTLKQGEFERFAHIEIPPSYKPEATPPLVLMLHGAGGTGTGALDKDGWSAKADKEGFIAVAPDGLPARPSAKPNFLTNPHLWNSGQLRPGSPRAAIDDVAYIRQLLDALKAKVPYDENRVFCAGHSNGGGMTFRLAAELSERFTAIGTVAGRLDLKDPKPKKPLPTLYILGTKDPLMPLDGGDVKLPWGHHQNPPVVEMLAVWVKALDCQPEPRTISDKDGVKKLEYASKTGGPTLTVLYIEGHGHHWPGGEPALPESMIGPITAKLDATDALWDFFEASARTAAK